MLKETTICQLFVHNEAYHKKVRSFLKSSYCMSEASRYIIDEAMQYYETKKTLNGFALYAVDKIHDDTLKKNVVKIINEEDKQIYVNVNLDEQIEETIRWIKHRTTLKTLSEGLKEWEVVEKDPDSKEFNYQLLINGFKSISSFNSVGFKANHFNFKEDGLLIRETLLNDVVRRVPFKSPVMNSLTRGGIYRKSFNVVAAPIHHGKSRFLSSIAVDYMEASKLNNILYITLEIPKTEVVENFEIHFLNSTYADYRAMTDDEYLNLKEKKMSDYGNIVIVEYPTGQLTVSGLRGIMDDALANGFNFNVVIIDYISLMHSDPRHSSYDKGEYLSQQLRGLAMEYDIVMWTAAQVNRGGAKRKGPADMTDIAESFAVGQTADFVMFGYKDKNLIRQNKMIWFVDKNRPGHIVWTNVIVDTTTYMFDFVHFKNPETAESTYGEDEKEESNTMANLKVATSLMGKLTPGMD